MTANIYYYKKVNSQPIQSLNENDRDIPNVALAVNEDNDSQLQDAQSEVVSGGVCVLYQ